ncbi:MAG: transglycosylase domain-containing protein, partial [Candidatus Dormibacteraceae bacterium]
TQQLVKLRLLKDSSQKFDRKIKEAILALQVDRTYSKHQVLEMYLNSVEYGDFATGAQAAAQNYFRKDTANLDLAEASMLAGIPQNPNYNSPLINSDQARARQAEVLDAMVRQGMITQDQSDRARVEKLDLHYPPNSIKAAPQFVSWIVKHLIAQYGARAAYSGGLHVVTSLNPTLQGIAESAVANNVSRVQQAGHNMHQGAMTSIDPATGEVLAMVGSVPNQPGSSYNFAADEPVNPGSTVKLFTYTAAIASGKYTMVTDVPDAPITVNMPGQDRNYSPKNYDSSSFPKCVFQTCMENSLNIPAVYVEISTGVDKVIDMARQLGAPPKYALQPGGPFSSDEPAGDFGAPFTLGGYPENPLLMSTATAAIAD